MKTAQKNKRLAVVIGNSEYHNLPKLANAVNDADAVKITLHSLGYKVLGNNDLERMDILKCFNNVLSPWKYEAKEIVFYYSGYGVSLDGKVYLAPTDSSKILPKSLIKQNLLDLDVIINTLLKYRINDSHPIVIILDFCRDEFWSNDDNEDPLRDVCREIGSKKINIAILYSTARGSVALDGKSKSNHSPYTQALLENIQKDQTIDQIHDNIMKSFWNSNKFCKQVHWMYQCLYESYRFRLPDPESILQESSLDDSVQYRFYNIPIKNQKFIDRSTILATMKAILNKRSSFDECRILTLCGLGGMGKTQLMLQYCYLHYKEYKYIFWLKMGGLSTALESFRRLSMNLGLDEESAKKMYIEEKIFDWVCEWLQKTTGWLLLLDNVNDEMATRVFTLLPRIGGDIIITTREHIPSTKAETIFIKNMEEEEALSLLLGVKSMRSVDRQSVRFHHAREIAVEMDFMPLAIDLARAYVETMRISFKEYLNMLRNQRSRAEIFSHHDEDSTYQYTYTIKTVWQLAFERVRNEDAMAGLILDACAFLQPDAIPMSFFERQYPVLEQKLIISSPEERSEGSDDIGKRVRKAIAVLGRSSLVAQMSKENTIKDEDPASDILTIHRLVQKVNFSAMSRQKKMQLACNVAEALNKEAEFSDPYSSISRTIMNIYLPHIRHFAMLFGDLNEDPLLSINFESLLVQTVDYLLDNGIHVGVEALATLAISVSELIHGVDNISTTRALACMAHFYYENGMFTDALPLCQRVLAIRKKALGLEHSDTATSLNNLARLYYSQSKGADAEPLYQQALTIRERVFGPEHQDVAMSLNNLALLYSDQGKFSDAEPLYQRALAISGKALGPEHPYTAISLKNLANLYVDQGMYNEAKPLLQRALVIQEKMFGPDHRDVATSLNNLALLHGGQGKFADAESLYQRALAIREKALGPEHPYTAISLKNLANLYTDHGKYNEARPLLQRALVIQEKVYGPEHRETANILDDLATMYSKQCKYTDAEPLYQRTLEIKKKTLGPEHSDVALTLENLANLYNNQGNYADAELLYQQALPIKEKVLGTEHPDTANCLNNLGELYNSQGRYADAEPLYQRSLAILEKVLGPENLITATILYNLAVLYKNQSKYADAEPLHQRALAIMNKVLGPGHPLTIEISNNLVLLYKKKFRSLIVNHFSTLYKQKILLVVFLTIVFMWRFLKNICRDIAQVYTLD